MIHDIRLHLDASNSLRTADYLASEMHCLTDIIGILVRGHGHGVRRRHLKLSRGGIVDCLQFCKCTVGIAFCSDTTYHSGSRSDKLCRHHFLLPYSNCFGYSQRDFIIISLEGHSAAGRNFRCTDILHLGTDLIFLVCLDRNRSYRHALNVHIRQCLVTHKDICGTHGITITLSLDIYHTISLLCVILLGIKSEGCALLSWRYCHLCRKHYAVCINGKLHRQSFRSIVIALQCKTCTLGISLHYDCLFCRKSQGRAIIVKNRYRLCHYRLLGSHRVAVTGADIYRGGKAYIPRTIHLYIVLDTYRNRYLRDTFVHRNCVVIENIALPII